MSYREKYRVSGYRSLPSSNRSSIYNLHTTDYNANINEDLTDFDRQFKKLLERTEKFTNRVEKLQSTATYIRRGFRRLDTTVTGLRSSRDAILNDIDYLDNRFDLDECPSTEEEWRKYVDLGVLIEKAVEILRFRYRCPKPVFEYSPEERSPYSIDITPRQLISPPRSPTDREGRRIRDLGSEIHFKYSNESKLSDTRDEKRKSPLLTKRKVDKFERKLDALTEIEEPRSPVEKADINGHTKYALSSKNQINTNFNSSSIFNKTSESPSNRLSIEADDEESHDTQGKGKRKSFLETLKNAATKRIGRSSDIKDEKEKRKSRTQNTSDNKATSSNVDDVNNRSETSPVKLRTTHSYNKRSHSIDARNKDKSDNIKDETDKRIKRLSSSSSFHEYNPSNRIPLRERLRMKEMAAKQEEKNEKTDEVPDKHEQKKDSRSSPEKQRRSRIKSDSSTTSNDDDATKSTSALQRKRSDSNKTAKESKQTKASEENKTVSPRVRKTLRKNSTLNDEEPQPERLPLRERRKMRMMSEEMSDADSLSPTDGSKQFSSTEKDDDVTKSPSEVLRSARIQKENQLSSSLSNRLQIARQKISRTNEILSTVESDIRNDLTLRETYTLQWEEKQRRMSEERKIHDKRKLERDQPYLYTNERPVKQLLKKQKLNTPDLMEKLNKMFKEVDEDRVVPTKHRTKDNYIPEFITPQSSRESIVEIEEPLEMSHYSDNSLNSSIFDQLNEIESPKYPSDDEIISVNIQNVNQVNELDFDKAFEYTLKEIEEDKIKEERKEKERIEKELKKEQEQSSEITEVETSENIDNDSVLTLENIEKEDKKMFIENEYQKTPMNEIQSEVEAENITNNTSNEIDVDKKTVQDDSEKERKSSVTVSINLSSPKHMKKEFSFNETLDEKINNEVKTESEENIEIEKDTKEEENITDNQSDTQITNLEDVSDKEISEISSEESEEKRKSNSVVSVTIKNITSVTTDPSIEVKQKFEEEIKRDEEIKMKVSKDLTPEIYSTEEKPSAHVQNTESAVTIEDKPTSLLATQSSIEKGVVTTQSSNEKGVVTTQSSIEKGIVTTQSSIEKGVITASNAIEQLDKTEGDGEKKTNSIRSISVKAKPILESSVSMETKTQQQKMSVTTQPLIESSNLVDLQRPQSSMDLLLEELDEMNRELFEDIESMQNTSRKSSRADLNTSNEEIINNKEHKQIFTISHSFDNLENMNEKSLDIDRPSSVCSDSPFSLSTPVSYSQENLNSKSNPDITRQSSDSLFTISKILTPNDNSLQTFSQYKEFNSKEDIRNSKYDDNNNNIKTSESTEISNRSESISSLSRLSKSSLYDSSEILYLKDSSQIKMGYREKREAHLKLLQMKKLEHDSIQESDEVFNKGKERTEVADENFERIEKESIEVGVESDLSTNDFQISIDDLSKENSHKNIQEHSSPDNSSTEKQVSNNVEKSASFDSSLPDPSRPQNKARTYYRKTKSTSDTKRAEFKRQVHSKSVEHY